MDSYLTLQTTKVTWVLTNTFIFIWFQNQYSRKQFILKECTSNVNHAEAIISNGAEPQSKHFFFSSPNCQQSSKPLFLTSLSCNHKTRLYSITPQCCSAQKYAQRHSERHEHRLRPLETWVQTSLHHRAGSIFHQGGGSKLKPQAHAVSFPSQGSRGRGRHCLLDIKSPSLVSLWTGGSWLAFSAWPVKVI